MLSSKNIPSEARIYFRREQRATSLRVLSEIEPERRKFHLELGSRVPVWQTHTKREEQKAPLFLYVFARQEKPLRAFRGTRTSGGIFLERSGGNSRAEPTNTLAFRICNEVKDSKRLSD